MIGTIGKPVIVNTDLKFAIKNVALIKEKNVLLNEYLLHKLSSKSITDQFEKNKDGGTQQFISLNNIRRLKISYPSLDEQCKLISFLNLINERIITQNKIIEKYESLIIGIRDIIFKSVNGVSRKLGDFLVEYTSRNTSNDLVPVSIGKYGIRSRESIYNKELSKDLSKNKVIFKDTLTIGMGSEQIDIGILLDDFRFCVSPAYSTYKIKNINSFYLKEYLLFLNPLLSKKYMIIGARQGKSVNKKELLLHDIFLHSEEEQNKIIKLIKTINKKIDNEEKLLYQLRKQKNYLLKNLFI